MVLAMLAACGSRPCERSPLECEEDWQCPTLAEVVEDCWCNGDDCVESCGRDATRVHCMDTGGEGSAVYYYDGEGQLVAKVEYTDAICSEERPDAGGYQKGSLPLGCD